MSGKIFFKIVPKFNSEFELNQENLRTSTKVKKEETFNINMDENKPKLSKTITNQSEIRECRVILEDVIKKIQKEEFKNLKTSENEPESKSNSKQKEESNNIRTECKFCGKKLMYKSFRGHMRKFHPNELRTIYCDKCDQELTIKNMKNHMIKVHSESEHKEYHCDFDGKVFDSRDRIKAHMLYHETKFKCEMCQKKIFRHKIKRHMMDVHTNEKKFQCKICQKYFKTNVNLNFHVKSHNKALKCSICPKMFQTRYCLNDHIKHSHENSKGFECEVCGKKINRKNNLKNHQKAHDKNRQKPYKCQRCEFSFDFTAQYKKHQQVHERRDKRTAAMKNPIKCDKCSTFCRNKNALGAHMDQVHPKVPFQCDLCGNYIKTKEAIKRHIINHMQQKKSL